MSKSTLKLNKTGEKKRRTFLVVISCRPEWKEVVFEGDELSNTDGIVEIWTDEKLSAVLNDFVYIKEVFEEKTPE